MGLPITCTSMQEEEKNFEAIFVIALSKYDGLVITNNNTKGFKKDSSCAKNKKMPSLIVSLFRYRYLLFSNELKNNNFEDNLLETDV